MTKRNYFLDFWKFIAALGVIMVHVPYGGKLGATLACVGNWGVSFFFLISGYMCFGDREKVCGKIARRFNQVSNLGKMLDPIADKLTIATIAVVLFLKFHQAQDTSIRAFSWVFLLFIVKDIVMLLFGAFR